MDAGGCRGAGSCSGGLHRLVRILLSATATPPIRAVSGRQRRALKSRNVPSRARSSAGCRFTVRTPCARATPQRGGPGAVPEAPRAEIGSHGAFAASGAESRNRAASYGFPTLGRGSTTRRGGHHCIHRPGNGADRCSRREGPRGDRARQGASHRAHFRCGDGKIDVRGSSTDAIES
jgi:hypothetical protein